MWICMSYLLLHIACTFSIPTCRQCGCQGGVLGGRELAVGLLEAVSAPVEAMHTAVLTPRALRYLMPTHFSCGTRLHSLTAIPPSA
jgi:hypothetical protein